MKGAIKIERLESGKYQIRLRFQDGSQDLLIVLAEDAFKALNIATSRILYPEATVRQVF